MIVTYAPADEKARTWDYQPNDLPSADAEEIEDAVGTTFDEFQVALLKGGMKARRALLWVFLRRDEPSLKFRDVSFKVGDLSVEWDAKERAAVRREIIKSKDVSDEDRALALSLLDDEDDEDPKE